MRNSYFDNLKFLLILCVAMIHFLECFRNEVVTFRGLYMFLGFFTMPAFALVSGYFSKRYEPRLKDISLLLVPYFVFQILYIAYYKRLALDSKYWTGGWSMATPFIHNWYLLSLLGWRLMSLYARQMRFALILSFTAGLLVVFQPSVDWTFSASRTLCFFPFFLIGMRLDEHGLARIWNVRWLGWVVLAGLCVLAFGLSYLSPSRANMVIWNIMYATGSNSLSGLVFRFGAYGLSLSAVFALLAVVPRRAVWFTRLGARTMSVYLLHAFFALGFEKLHPQYHPGLSEAAALGGAVVVTLLLSANPVYNGLMAPFLALNRWLQVRTGHA